MMSMLTCHQVRFIQRKTQEVYLGRTQAGLIHTIQKGLGGRRPQSLKVAVKDKHTHRNKHKHTLTHALYITQTYSIYSINTYRMWANTHSNLGSCRTIALKSFVYMSSCCGYFYSSFFFLSCFMFLTQCLKCEKCLSIKSFIKTSQSYICNTEIYIYIY